MKRFQDLVFDGLRADHGGIIAEDMLLDTCEFKGCSLRCWDSPLQRPIIRRVSLRNCRTTGESVTAPILDEVYIDGLKTNTLVIAFATLCRHVTFKGRIGKIMFSPVFTPGTIDLPVNALFARHKREFYESVDWAVDVRDADPDELQLTDIPGRLVRRNPDASVRLLRANLTDGRWKRPGVLGTACATGIEHMFKSGLDDMVLVAWPRQRNWYKQDLEAFRILKGEGIAEPD